MKKPKIGKAVKYAMFIECIFIIILIANFLAFYLNPSQIFRTTLIIEIILLIIAKNYLKDKMIKRMVKSY
jgi:hypothetical protein